MRIKVLVTKYAFYSKVGYIPETTKQNQDAFIVHPKVLGNYTQHLFGVADGHGQYGKEVSTLVKQHYSTLFEANLKLMSVVDAFVVSSEQLDKIIKQKIVDIDFSGTTCVIVYIHDQELYTANIGDSRAILCTYDKGSLLFQE